MHFLYGKEENIRRNADGDEIKGRPFMAYGDETRRHERTYGATNAIASKGLVSPTRWKS